MDVDMNEGTALPCIFAVRDLPGKAFKRDWLTERERACNTSYECMQVQRMPLKFALFKARRKTGFQDLTLKYVELF